MLSILGTVYTSTIQEKAGFLLLEQSAQNAHRSNWEEGVGKISCLHRSKRFVAHVDVLGQALRWMVTHGTTDSVVTCNEEELLCFLLFPETF